MKLVIVRPIIIFQTLERPVKLIASLLSLKKMDNLHIQFKKKKRANSSKRVPKRNIERVIKQIVVRKINEVENISLYKKCGQKNYFN